jgi:drug/metabolite transporter (DMT)-like permease
MVTPGHGTGQAVAPAGTIVPRGNTASKASRKTDILAAEAIGDQLDPGNRHGYNSPGRHPGSRFARYHASPEISLAYPVPGTRKLNPLGLAWALAAASLGSTVGVADKWLLVYNAGPLPVSALRASLAVVALGLGLLLRQRAAFRVSWRHLPFFALFGLVGVTAVYLLYILAVLEVGATLATALFYTYPTMATLLAAAFLKERLTWRKAVPLPVTFAGCALAAGLGSGGRVELRPAGVAVALLAAATFALYPLFARRALARYSSWTALFYSLLFGAVWLDALWAVLSLFLPPDGTFCGTLPALAVANSAFWGTLLYLALGATVGLYLADLQAIYRLEVRVVGLIGTLEPFLAGLLAYLIFGEQLTLLQWAGAAFIVSGVLWLRLEE